MVFRSAGKHWFPPITKPSGQRACAEFPVNISTPKTVFVTIRAMGFTLVLVLLMSSYLDLFTISVPAVNHLPHARDFSDCCYRSCGGAINQTIKNPAIADGVKCVSSAGGLIRNHTSCPAFPKGGSCMAFSSVFEHQAPQHPKRRMVAYLFSDVLQITVNWIKTLPPL